MEHWNLLPHLTGIRLQGPDANAFAHAQFTTAFNQDTAPGWGLTAWCNPKGRVIAVMLARVDELTVELIAPECLGAIIAQRLPIYAIGRKVEITPGLKVAGRLNGGVRSNCQIRLDGDRSLLLDPTDELVDEDFVDDWKASDVRAGIVWLTGEQSEQHLPQALGLQEREGLSFTKGCYPGQEIVARVHYLGRAKQMLKAFRISGAPEEALDQLHDHADTPLGPVVSVARASEDLIGLVVVAVETPPDQVVRIGGHSGRLYNPGDLSLEK